MAVKKKRKRKPPSALLRSYIKAETNSSCAMPTCGRPGDEIHHINEDPSDTVFLNLIWLCGSCHKRQQRGDITEQHIRRVKAELVLRDERSTATMIPGLSLSDLTRLAPNAVTKAFMVEQSKKNASAISLLIANYRPLIEEERWAEALPRVLEVKALIVDTSRLGKTAAKLFNDLGSCFFLTGCMEDAKAAYRDSISIHPGWKAKRNLANVFSLEGDHERAFQYAREARKSKRDHGGVQALWALSSYWTGRANAEQTIERMEKAVDLGPEDPGVNSNLAMLLAKSGQPARAAELLLALPEQDGRMAFRQLQIGVGFLCAAFARLGEREGWTHENGAIFHEITAGRRRERIRMAELDGARRALEHALAHAHSDPLFRPEDVAASHENLGNIDLLEERHASAFRRMRLAVRDQKGQRRAECHLRMCQVLAARQHSRWLIPFVEKHCPELKEDRDVIAWTAMVHMRLGDVSVGVALLRPICATSDAPLVYVQNLATALAVVDDLGEEFRALMQRLEAAGSSGPTWENAATMCMGRGDMGAAWPYVEKALALNPASKPMLEFLGRALMTWEEREFLARMEGSEEGLFSWGGSLAWAGYWVRQGNLAAAARHVRRVLRASARKRHPGERLDHAVASRLARAIDGGRKGARVNLGTRLAIS